MGSCSKFRGSPGSTARPAPFHPSWCVRWWVASSGIGSVLDLKDKWNMSLQALQGCAPATGYMPQPAAPSPSPPANTPAAAAISAAVATSSSSSSSTAAPSILISSTSTNGFACLSDEWPDVKHSVLESVPHLHHAMLAAAPVFARHRWQGNPLQLEDAQSNPKAYLSVRAYQRSNHPSASDLDNARLTKFQNLFLRSVLLSTGTSRLHDSSKDQQMAESLMGIRERLRASLVEEGFLHCAQCASAAPSPPDEFLTELHVAAHTLEQHPPATWWCSGCQKEMPFAAIHPIQ